MTYVSALIQQTSHSSHLNWLVITLIGLLGLGILAGLMSLMYRLGQRRARQAARELVSLNEIGRRLLRSQLDVDTLCELVYWEAGQIISTSTFQLGLFDEESYHVKVWTRDNQRLPQQVFPDGGRQGIIGWVRQTGQSLLVHDFEAERDMLPDFPSFELDAPPRSGLFVPLIAGTSTIGVIAIQSREPRHFAEEQARLLTVLANQTASAIQNAQLYQRAQRRAEQLNLIGQVSARVSAVQPLRDLFHQSVELIKDTFGYYSVSIVVCKGDSLIMGASTSPEFAERAPTVEVGAGLIGWAAAEGRTALANNVNEDDRYLHIAALADTKSEIVLPLRIEDRILGVLDVQSNQIGAFNSEDVFLLEALSAQMALAIEQAQTYDAEHRLTQRLETLTQVVQAVVSILDLDELLDEVVDLIVESFGYERVHVFIRLGDQLVFRAGSGAHSARWLVEGLAYDWDSAGLIPWVARTGKAALIEDVSQDSHYRPGPGLQDTHTEMTVPIQMGGQVLGVLDLQSRELNAFTIDDLVLTQSLADSVAVAIRNAALYANEWRRRNLADTLREISAKLASDLDLDSVLRSILSGLERVINLDTAAILLMDEEANSFTVMATAGPATIQDVVGRRVPVHPADQGNVHSDATGMRHLYHELLGFPENHSCIEAPLLIENRLLGYLMVDHHQPEHFNEHDTEIVLAFANQAAAAINNARLYTLQREEAWISSALLQVAEATTKVLTLQDVLDTVARITPRLAGVDWCAVMLLEADDINDITAYDVKGRTLGTFIQVSIRPGEWRELDALRQHDLAQVIAQYDPIPQQFPPMMQQGLRLLIPFHHRDELAGAMLVGQIQDTETGFTERRIALLSGIANQAALAIDSAQSYAAQQAEVWITTALLQVAEAVNAQVDLTESLETIARLTTMLVGVTKCVVLRWDQVSQSYQFIAGHGFLQERYRDALSSTLEIGEHPLLDLLSIAEAPIGAGEGYQLPIPTPLERLFQTDAVLGFRLMARGGPVGLLIVDDIWQGTLIDPRLLKILTGIAYQVGLALETAALQITAAERDRLERELDVARQIQASFMPEHAPQEMGWQLAATWRAARQVGGDFYDFIPLKGGQWGLVIADVADKGVPAALFMALCRTLVRAAAINRTSPARTLERVNELLLNDSRADMFVTVFYAVWDPTTGELTYASAGHNPPIFVRGQAEGYSLLTSKGIALGVIPRIHLEEHQKRLQPGDIVAAYTDGITEACQVDYTEWGLDALAETLIRSRDTSAEYTVQEILSSLDGFVAGAPQSDDLTLWILKRDAPQPPSAQPN